MKSTRRQFLGTTAAAVIVAGMKAQGKKPLPLKIQSPITHSTCPTITPC
jgi:hypothetical protein